MLATSTNDFWSAEPCLHLQESTGSEYRGLTVDCRWGFLLAPLESEFDFVVGNTPCVRQEPIPVPLLTEYRSRYQTRE